MQSGLLEVKRLLTATEVSELCHLSKESVWYYTRIGVLKAIRIGRQYRYNPSTIAEFIANGGCAVA